MKRESTSTRKMTKTKTRKSPRTRKRKRKMKRKRKTRTKTRRKRSKRNCLKMILWDLKSLPLFMRMRETQSKICVCKNSVSTRNCQLLALTAVEFL